MPRGELPAQLAGLNRSHITVHQLAVEAALNGSRDALYQAVMLDPHTASVLTLDEIWRMTDELIDAHGDALPRMAPRRLYGAPNRPAAPLGSRETPPAAVTV